MKLDLPNSNSLDGVSINNGEFDIILDSKSFRSVMEFHKRTVEEIAGLWKQLVKFASDVEMSRLSGVALGSSDPIGALDDQVYRFNVTVGGDIGISDDDIMAMIKTR